MPNIKSAMKRDEKSKLENARNKAQKTALKTVMKKFDAAVAEGNKEAAAGTYKVCRSCRCEGSYPQEQRSSQEERHDGQAQRNGIMHKKTPAHMSRRFYLFLSMKPSSAAAQAL